MTKRFNDVVKMPGFEAGLKKLQKKYPTLHADLAILINNAIFAFHKLEIGFHGIVQIDDLGNTKLPVYKVKKFACRSLKGKGARTGLRLIYAYNEGKDQIELIEIYIKSQKETEDRKRINKLYG